MKKAHDLKLICNPGEGRDYVAQGFDCRILLDGEELKGVTRVEIDAKAGREVVKVNITLAPASLEVEGNFKINYLDEEDPDFTLGNRVSYKGFISPVET